MRLGAPQCLVSPAELRIMPTRHTSRRAGIAISPSVKNAMGLVRQFHLPQHDARQIRVQRVDFAHRPAIESLGDHDVDEVENLHATNVAHG